MPFNLFADPWIPVVYTEGTATSVGVRTALAEAHRIRALNHAEPMIEICLHRLLLALTHRLCGPVDTPTWHRLWEQGRLPTQGLDQIGQGRWDLFSATGDGFAQDPVQTPQAKPVADMTALADRGAAAGFLWDPPEVLTPAEAAQWLLWVHTYDTGGIRTKHGGGRAMGTPMGALGRRPHTRLLGSTLAHTLLLNLTPGTQAPAGQGWWEHTAPVVERRKGRTPEGMVDYLCWPARRVRLLPEADGMVRQVVVCAGDDLKEHPDPAVGGPQLNLRARVGVNATALTATVPGLVPKQTGKGGRSAAPSTPQVIDWLAERHHAVDQVGVETTTLIADVYGAKITDRTQRTLYLPTAALVPGTEQHAHLERAHTMLKTAASGIRDIVQARQHPAANNVSERADAQVELCIQSWSDEVAAALRGVDLHRIHRVLSAAVQAEADRSAQIAGRTSPGMIVRTAGEGLRAGHTANQCMLRLTPDVQERQS